MVYKQGAYGVRGLVFRAWGLALQYLEDNELIDAVDKLWPEVRADLQRAAQKA